MTKLVEFAVLVQDNIDPRTLRSNIEQRIGLKTALIAVREVKD